MPECLYFDVSGNFAKPGARLRTNLDKGALESLRAKTQTIETLPVMPARPSPMTTRLPMPLQTIFSRR